MLGPNCVLSPAAPRDLLTQDRLDIAIKWRYFRHLWTSNGRDDTGSDAVRRYRWHILERTNGKEPRSWKATIADYETAARALHGAMLAYGFDRNHPIEIGSCGGLIDGAHRLACALALDFDEVPLLQHPHRSKAQAWGMAWLKDHALGAHDRMAVLTDWRSIAR